MGREAYRALTANKMTALAWLQRQQGHPLITFMPERKEQLYAITDAFRMWINQYPEPKVIVF